MAMPCRHLALALALSACSMPEGKETTPSGGKEAADPGFGLFPLANAGADREILRGATARLDGGGTFHPGARSVTLRWEQIAGPAVFLSNAAVATPSFVAPLAEVTLGFRLTASDGDFHTTDEVALFVRTAPSSSTPRVRAGPDRLLAEGAAAQIEAADLVAATPADAVVTWETVTPSAEHVARGLAVAAPLATVFRASVASGGLASAPDYLVVWPFDAQLVGERAPSSNAAAAAAAVVAPGEQFALSAKGSTDPNGDALAYRWVEVRGEATSVTKSGDALLVEAPTHADELVFRLYTRDGKLESAPVDVSIVVHPAAGTAPPLPTPPVELRAHPAATVMLAALGSRPASDYPADATFAWSVTVGPNVTLIIDPSTRVASFGAPLLDNASPLEIGVAVTSSVGKVTSAPAVTRVTVVPQSDNAPPTLSVCLSTAAPTFGQVTGARVDISDPEGDEITGLDWTSPNCPTLLFADGAPLDVVWPCATSAGLVSPLLATSVPATHLVVHFTAPGSGTSCQITVRATDALSAASEQSVVFAVP